MAAPELRSSITLAPRGRARTGRGVKPPPPPRGGQSRASAPGLQAGTSQQPRGLWGKDPRRARSLRAGFRSPCSEHGGSWSPAASAPSTWPAGLMGRGGAHRVPAPPGHAQARERAPVASVAWATRNRKPGASGNPAPPRPAVGGGRSRAGLLQRAGPRANKALFTKRGAAGRICRRLPWFADLGDVWRMSPVAATTTQAAGGALGGSRPGSRKGLCHRRRGSCPEP